jgi:hypothetical protein
MWLVALATCGGVTTKDGGDAAADGATNDAPVFDDAGVDISGPYACGSITCGPGEYCVHPCCGGDAPLPCTPMPDSGMCPVGTHAEYCRSLSAQGCVDDPCKPPPPYCEKWQYCAIGYPKQQGRDIHCGDWCG